MKETEKLKLKLPEISDWADITALNDTPAKEHTHTKKDITDFPTSLPASDVYDWAKQPEKPVYAAGEVGAAQAATPMMTGIIRRRRSIVCWPPSRMPPRLLPPAISAARR